MNRHERRAQAAQTRLDKGFEEFQRQAKRTFAAMSDRDIGAAWMRGQAWEASGAEAMVLHKPGETRKRSDTDIRVSVTYGNLKFRAFVTLEDFTQIVGQWPQIVDEFNATVERQGGKRHDTREATRGLILKEMIHYDHVQGEPAAALTAAIGWLATTSPAGGIFTRADVPYRALHYEITDIMMDGRRANNFRLVLGNWEDDEPLPEVVRATPSPFDDATKEDSA
jgi:hypothetical protein